MTAPEGTSSKEDIASYPTKLPFHFQSPYLIDDSLQDILAACHLAGIRVMAQTDFPRCATGFMKHIPKGPTGIRIASSLTCEAMSQQTTAV